MHSSGIFRRFKTWSLRGSAFFNRDGPFCPALAGLRHGDEPFLHHVRDMLKYVKCQVMIVAEV